MSNGENDNPVELLRRSGYKATRGRERILEILIEEERPMTVSEIDKKLGRKGVNEVTLYRALEALAFSRVVRKVDFQTDNARRYEFVKKHHHHIVCSGCGAVESFSDKLCGGIVKNAIRKSKIFTRADDHSLEIFGLCSKCSR